VFAQADVQKDVASALSALAIDAALEKLLDQAELAVQHRSGQESVDGIEAEYEHGRLYFIGIEERPLLRGRAKAAQMGHLFCDVKDFTRRTAFLKEAVVADFLSREFYTPILTAAARHHHGAAHLKDRGGIYLNNLLGDAVSFSGDVVALVELAHDIRRALNSYAKRLDAESGSEVVARSIAAIDERAAARRAELQQQMAQAQAAMKARSRDASGEDPQVRLSRLQAEVARLEDERKAEIALAAGEKLEAGIFISYGAAPEVATFEDHVFGAMKVAIAEKINESARGTARNGGVRSRIDAFVRQQRATRNNADLSCPFLVSVSQPLSVPVPADAEAAIMGCLSGGDAKMAELLLQRSVRQFVASLAQDRGGSTGDIYNGGAALSEEALRAYVTARDGEFLFLSRRVSVSALHASIVERFVFPMDTLQLVAAVEPGAQALQELYVHVGRALFKGFEKTGGLGVYEIIPPGSPFFSLLAQHHLPRWLVEHEHGRSNDPRSSAAGA
jgi:class 3 adenylate cyclase